MSRSLVVLDRLVTTLVGAVLIGIAVMGALWQTGNLTFVSTPLAADFLDDLDRFDWWPWAVGGGGIVLTLIGMRWFVAHLGHQGIDRLTLPGSTRANELSVDSHVLIDVAADQLEQTKGVRKAYGRTVSERGQVVMVVSVTVELSADLSSIGRACDVVAEQLATATGRDDVSCRFELSAARHGHRMSRVS